SKAAEPARECDVGDRKLGLGQQLLREQEPAREDELHRRDAERALEHATDLPRAPPELSCDRLDAVAVIGRAFGDALRDERADAMRIVDRRVARREFRAATQAWPEVGMLRRLGAREEAAIRAL